VNNTYPAGLGEPLNIILSGDSDDDVLVQSTDNGGFLNYMLYANSLDCNVQNADQKGQQIWAKNASPSNLGHRNEQT